jgi:hypothetical protein
MKLNFDILFQCSLADIIARSDISISNEYILSIINGYEDKKWQYENFKSFIWNNIAETALTQKEREALLDFPFDILKEATKNLRLIDSEDDPSKGSEIAEIVLYGILKNYYKALSVVPKIFYKQNPNDNAKGADSVHIVLNEEDDFSLWFGEAKFYKSIDNSNLSKIIKSVESLLQPEKIRKENKIITNVKELDFCLKNETVRKRIIEMLSNDVSLDCIRPKLHIPIFLLYECEITARYTEKSDEYRQEVSLYHKERAEFYFRKQITQLSHIPKYEEAHFHLIIFPVPQKQIIVDDFIKQSKILRGDNNV